MKLKELLSTIINEDLQLVKFKYNNYKQDPKPRVKVLDFQYKGQPHQSTYGKREDLLGFNLNYFKNSKYAAKAIDDIDGFARMLSANKDEKYRRLKYFYPEIIKYIRRYNREHIEGIKRKNKFIYHNTDYKDLIRRDQDSF